MEQVALHLLASPMVYAHPIACAPWQAQGEANIDFVVAVCGRPQRTILTARAPSDDLRCAPRRDARFARHTHLSTPR